MESICAEISAIQNLIRYYLQYSCIKNIYNKTGKLSELASLMISPVAIYKNEFLKCEFDFRIHQVHMQLS